MTACPRCDGLGTVDLTAEDYEASEINWIGDVPGMDDCGDCDGTGQISESVA